jgi:hypothetical protein
LVVKFFCSHTTYIPEKNNFLPVSADFFGEFLHFFYFFSRPMTSAGVIALPKILLRTLSEKNRLYSAEFCARVRAMDLTDFFLSAKSIADCRLPIADCRLPIADCRLPIADCRLPIADCRLPIADCRLPGRG